MLARFNSPSRRSALVSQVRLIWSTLVMSSDCKNVASNVRRSEAHYIPMLRRGFEVMDEVEEVVDVDGFRNEGQIPNRQSALAVFFACITRHRNRRYVAQPGKEAQLFEKLITVNVWHTDVGNDDVRTPRDRAAQRLRG